jgi:hypothetical protein
MVNSDVSLLWLHMISHSILRGQPCLTVSCRMGLDSSGLFVLFMCEAVIRFSPVKAPAALLIIHVILLSSNGNVLGGLS